MDEKKTFEQLLASQKLRKGDVIFVLQGDGTSRASVAAALFENGWASEIAIVGNANDRAYGSFPSIEIRDSLIRKLGIPADRIFFEETAHQTRKEAERAMELAKEKGWKTILIVTSANHEARAFLTFLKAMRDASLDLVLIHADPELPEATDAPWSSRPDLVAQESGKIEQYQKKGDVASYEDGIAYLTTHL